MLADIPHMDLIVFLAEAVGISLSGVMAPGPVTAVTLGMGARNRHAGALVAVGHGIVEFPLMALLCVGVGQVFKVPQVRVGIGLAGGAMLLLMGIGMLRESRKVRDLTPTAAKRGPILTGVVLSAGNPLFLIWWATAGLTIATDSAKFGILAFAVFAVLHWLCDLVWLEALSWTSHKGTTLLGIRGQKIVLAVCGAALVGFAGRFFWRSGWKLAGMLGHAG